MVVPSEALISDIKSIKGDILILGVGGKMGPSLARLAVRAIRAAGESNRVIGVSRFSEQGLKEELEDAGVEAIVADLMNDDELASLPDCENVIYMVGKKFGTTGQEHLTWAMNAYLPGRVANRFKNSRIVAFSSGNIYPFVSPDSGGATEQTAPNPVGEYAQSCLGRERIFQYFSHLNKTPMLIYRLNYAIDLKYGNLLEIGNMVKSGRAIDLKVGQMNVIWQGDANEVALRSLLHCDSPPTILNVTGPETVSIRWVAEEFARKFEVEAKFTAAEPGDCLLNNASACHQLFGYPRVTLREMIDLTAEWIIQGGKTINKPTHFQETEGKF